MIKIYSLRVLLTFVFASCVLQPLAAQGDPGPEDDPEPIELTADRFNEFRTHIVPSDQEMKFLEVGWRPTLWQARREAQRKEKPLLLWVMNGHPLGHT